MCPIIFYTPISIFFVFKLHKFLRVGIILLLNIFIFHYFLTIKSYLCVVIHVCAALALYFALWFLDTKVSHEREFYYECK
jgi:hypothetical protein